MALGAGSRGALGLLLVHVLLPPPPPAAAMRLSELAAALGARGVDQAQIDACFDADDPRAQAEALLRAADAAASPEPDTDDGLLGHGAMIAAGAGCGAAEVLVPPGVCEAFSPEASDSASGAAHGVHFAYREAVPVLSADLPAPLAKHLPWLRRYIAERYPRWQEQETALDDWDKFFHKASYSFLESGRTNKERRRLGQLQDFIQQMLVTYLQRWQQTAAGSESQLATWKPYVQAVPWQARPDGALIESWANRECGPPLGHRASPLTVARPPCLSSAVHQRTHSGYRPGKYIMPHEHMFPVNGFLSVDVNGSDTLLRSPITGRVFKLGGRAGRMVLFPGGVRHTVPPWSHAEAPGSPRMSVAFNIDWVAAGSKSRCVIPLRMVQ